jgi:hypothetical protein
MVLYGIWYNKAWYKVWYGIWYMKYGISGSSLSNLIITRPKKKTEREVVEKKL